MFVSESKPSVKQIIAANLNRIVRARFPNPESAAKAAKIAPQQLRRILAADHAITMRTVEKLAEGFGFEPYQLLVPGLDPKNPQVLRMLSPEEETLYKALEEARKGAS